MTDIEKINESLFESIKHINEYGQEYWTARELMLPLQYKKWQNFDAIIQKAKQACKSSNGKVSDHFADVSKMVTAGVAAKSIDDYHLSRYACYLIAMNGDPRKQAIALAQTYFAIKTRQQELIENYNELSEDQKRLAIRTQIVEHNKSLADAAHNAGVNQGVEYAIFQNHGYMGLYGGLTAKDIHSRKGLKKSQKILDHMGSTELAANLFRATQTDEKLRRDNIKGKDAANQTHYEVGKAVRQTIKNLGGTMPEDLPTPEKSVQQIEREQKKKLQ
ncbi:DNA damage-inducible protein D [Selenomonas ruminantium]|uniref:DNA damage-inducible protein D n=1 Tax=Selenomonas ruminantium TaxID=971 RepID=UPI0026F2A748|nr:DNA damage-inducible protein D [Selenomonas ruminantium]